MSDALLPADWPAPPGVYAFTTQRRGAGVSQPPFDRFNLGERCGDAPKAVAANRAELAALAALPSPPRWLRQVHGTRVQCFDDRHPEPPDCHPAPSIRHPEPPGCHPERSEGSAVAGSSTSGTPPPGNRLADQASAHDPEADAATTRTPGTVLAILTADCLPVLLCAHDGSEVGAAHAGWRGLAAGVLEATVEAMHTPPARLMAWLGPAAGPRHYEVGAEVFDAFIAHDDTARDAFVVTRPRHWHIDLYALARRRLQAAGLAAEHIHGGGLCTIAEPQRFYSHRRDARTGRMASLIWMQP